MKSRTVLAFPLPSLLPTIEELLQEVQWLDGLILITDSQRATFVSFAQVDPLLRRLRRQPRGMHVRKSSACPCLKPTEREGCRFSSARGWQFLARNDGDSHDNPHRRHAVAHLNRCFELKG